jgi:phosphinothricin acetyltransferase
MSNIDIREARPSDAQELLEIYAPYVLDTAVTFEYDGPTAAEFTRRISDTLKKYPYIVALENGRIIGYAYASPFKERAAYDWCIETSIYVMRGHIRRGCGRLLYNELERLLKKQNVLNMNACIAYTDIEDAHLTNASTEFHKHMGFSPAAKFNKCGYKFGTWYDMIWMEKHIGVHSENPPAFIPYPDIRGAL